MKKIAFPNGSGISVIHPCDCGLTIEQIAEKDVPTGIPYIFIEEKDIPSNRENREAWQADFSKPDGVGK